MHYYCRRESAGSALNTNLQLYFLRKASEAWNEPEVEDIKERRTFILVCLGVSLKQLLGQNPPSPEIKKKVDEPGVLLGKILKDVDRPTRARLNNTFRDFLRYYGSVRHFGKNKDEMNYQIIDKLTRQELARFCRMAIQVWDLVIAIYRRDDPKDLLEIKWSISDEVQFKNLPE